MAFGRQYAYAGVELYLRRQTWQSVREMRAIYANRQHKVRSMALYVIHQAYKNCKIKPGDTIVEATSGNTGISFSAIGKALGHPVKIIMPNWLSKERIAIIESMGARGYPYK